MVEKGVTGSLHHRMPVWPEKEGRKGLSQIGVRRVVGDCDAIADHITHKPGRNGSEPLKI